jgi:regulator of replication initiation timing
MNDHNGTRPPRTMREIVRAYRTIKREKEEMRTAMWYALQREPRFDPDVLADDTYVKDRRALTAEEREKLKLERQWRKLCDATDTMEAEAIAMFTVDELEELKLHTQKLVDEAHALCLKLQEACPRLRNDGFDTDELCDLERWYRAQRHATERLSRRWDNWGDLHNAIERAVEAPKRAKSEFVN